MKKVFLDTDVVLDFLIDRAPHADAVAGILQQSIKDDFEACVSSLTISNLNYIIARIETRRSAKSKIIKLLNVVQVENVGASTIAKAVKSKFKDLEDAIQHYSAQEAGHKVIVTRNIKDYKQSELGVLTPVEFLATL